MSKLQGSVRVAPQFSRHAARQTGSAPKKAMAAGAAIVMLWILFWLIFYQNLPPNFGLNGTPLLEDDAIEHTINKILKACMLAMSIYVIATRWPAARSFAKGINIGAAGMVVLAGVSTAWSIEPDATISGTLTLSSTVLISFAICLGGWNRLRFQQLALPPLMYILIVSLVVGMIYPDKIIEVGTDLSQKDAWHGITLTKNQFAMTSSVAVIIWVNKLLAGEGRALWAVVGAAVSFTCLILSRGNASLFASLLAILLMVLVMKVQAVKQQFTTPVVVGLLAMMSLYEMVIQNVLPGVYTLMAPVRALTGKDGTFSARTQIWDLIKLHMQVAPKLGTGYGAYWLGAIPRSPSYIFWQVMYFYPTEAHNGYLDIMNDLGYAGLACLIVFLITYARQALQLMRFDRNQAALYLGLLIQQMAINMSESDYFQRTSTFALFSLAVFCLSRQLHEARMQAQPARAGR